MRRMLFMACALLASGCVVREYREPPPPPVAYQPPPLPPPPPPVVQQDPQLASVYIDPPVEQPAAVAIPWAPPPMLWDPPPPQPWVDAIWIGGHWTWWNGEWVWARGRWARPPSPGWVYAEPYYEYRGDAVVFVAGFWRPVTRVFIPPPPTVYVPVVQVRVVHVGYARPIGPHGVFVPPPPGSQPGVIVPCPVGTPPAVVLSAPPVVRPGMVVRPVPRGGVVEVVAPSGVTREGRPVTAQAPIASHDAATVHPVVVTSPPPVRNASFDRPGHPVGPPSGGPEGFPGRPAAPATMGGQPVNVPVSQQPGGPAVSVRPLPEGQPVRGGVRPESMGGEPGARPWSEPGRGEGPMVRPVERQEMTPRPAQAGPSAPPPQAAAPHSAPAVAAPPAAPPRVESTPPRGKPVKEKGKPDERKGHPDPHER